MTRLRVTVICLLLGLLFCVLIGCGVYLSVGFNNGCGGHLRRAAYANTPQLAAEELQTAIDYLEQNGLTSGYTNVLWRLPCHDIGFWYRNLKASKAELDSLPATATQLERSNVLIKLRETLLDHRQNGTRVTCPPNIDVYPYHLVLVPFTLIAVVALPFVFVAWVVVMLILTLEG